MRKLCKLLTALSLTTIIPINVIACGGSPDTIVPKEGKDISSLLKAAENKVNDLLANLTSKNQNLFKPGLFQEEDSGPLLTNINKSNSNQKIDDTTITNPLFTFIQKLISDFGDELANEPDLKGLFYGINTTEILKFKLDNSTIFKHTFGEWQKDNSFFNGYKKENFNIQSWNYLSANLSLILKYKDNENQIIQTDIKPKFDFYFSNQEAKIDKIIDLVTDNSIKKLKDYLAAITGDKKYYINTYLPSYFDLLQNDIVATINNYLNDENIKINTTTLINTKSMANDYNKYKYYKNDNEEEMTRRIFNDQKIQEETFSTMLDEWDGKSLIPAAKLPNVSFVGDLKLLDWKYKDITLKSQEIKTAIIENETRTQKMQTTAKKMAKLCNLQDGLLKNKINFNSQADISVTMNATDFDNYVKNGNTFVDVMDLYVNEKVKTLTKKAAIIDDNDFFIAKLWFPSEKLSRAALNKHLNSDKTKATFQENDPTIIRNCIYFLINNYYFNNRSWPEYKWTIIRGENDNIWPV